MTFGIKKILALLTSVLLAFLPEISLSQSKLDGNWQEPVFQLPLIGVINTRTTHEIEASPWSVGGETMDRDYTVYANWKDHVEALGIKRIRLQSGWAKTEKQKGKYDFQWMDDIVFDLQRKGVKPWISLSYGNPVYKGGGGTRLGAQLPTSGEAYKAWRDYIAATVNRYKEVVNEWEIWNEPDSHNSDELYGKLLLESGKLIKSIQPEAQIIGLAIAGIRPEWAEKVLQYLKKRNGLQYVDMVSYHPYNKNPDDSYPEVQKLQEVVLKYSENIRIFQGENGAPSEFRKTKALRNYAWTELSQAKWALRRMLGDLGRDIPSSYFSMVDMKYPDEINRKGLLLIDEDKKVIRRKHAYFALQHLASVFDNKLQRIADYPYQKNTYHGMSVFAYRTEGTGQQVVTIWFDENIPSDHNSTTAVDFTFPEGQVENPVYVDLRTGRVYDITERHWRTEGQIHYFYAIPVYDSPILIADRSAVSFKK